jgi:cytochrome c-type biogenesis protein CcmH/NrfG
MPETYARYGATFVTDGRRYDYAIELFEQAERILPSSITVRMFLASAYLKADRKEDAVAAASSVLAWSHDESDIAKAARAILILAKQDSGTD